jgi:phosphoribosyl 1,2-cyclic phosphodiesterase
VRLEFCGVRGSTPAPGADFVRYGGHTSCVAVAHDGAALPTLILDAGTGVRRVTTLLAGQPFTGTILLTHLHWDHVQGLPFFRAGDRDDAQVTLLLPDQQDGQGAEDEYHAAAVELAAGADVLVHDAQLLAEEVAAEAAFGHAAADYAVALAKRAGARQVVLFHHRPDRTDDALDQVERRFAAAEVPVLVAAEGLILDL